MRFSIAFLVLRNSDKEIQCHPIFLSFVWRNDLFFVHEKVQANKWEPMSISNSGPKVSHLFFAK